MAGRGEALHRVAVLGGGSAGLLIAIGLKHHVPQLEVIVVRSPRLGVIGVGESTTPLVPLTLHPFLDIDPHGFHRAVRPTYKLGIRFLWGPFPRFHFTFTPQYQRRCPLLPGPSALYCGRDVDYADVTAALMARDLAFERAGGRVPRVGGHLAYHLENRRLVEYLETHARGLAVRFVDGEVRATHLGREGVRALDLGEGRRVTADLYVDCSGFRARVLGEALGEPFVSYRSTLFCDRAVVGDWERSVEPVKPYTTAETMGAGWAWQIEHDEVINRGYVYASAFLSDEAAERELRGRSPKLRALRVIQFRSGRYQRAWVKNVVALGNAAGFVEPLESSALAVVCDAVTHLVTTLRTSYPQLPGEASRRTYNRHHAWIWDSTRRFLAIHYRFNARVRSPFWRVCRAEAALCGAEEIVDHYRENGPDLDWPALRHLAEPFGVEGYLALLVGQGVPYRARGRAAPQERRLWRRYRAWLRGRARGGLSMREGLARIRADSWEWTPEMFVNAKYVDPDADGDAELTARARLVGR